MDLNPTPQREKVSADPAPPPVPRKSKASIINILGLLLIIDATLMLSMRVPGMIEANSVFGPRPSPKNIYDLLSTALLFFSSFGLLMRKPWARMLILCLMLFSLVEGIFDFVFFSSLLDFSYQAGDPDSFLTWHSFQILAACLVYTFFIAMLFTRKVKAEFGLRADGQPSKGITPRQLVQSLRERIGPLDWRNIAGWAGAVLVLGLGVWSVLSAVRVPRSRPSNPGRMVWTGMGNLGRTGSVPGRGVHEPDELLWKKSGFSRNGGYLLAAGDMIYGTNNKRLYALDASTGELKWIFSGNPVSSDPLLIDDTVFVGSDIGALYAIDAARGQEKWRYQTGKGLFKLNMTPIATAPVSDGGAVYFGNALGYLYAVDLASKKELWKFKAGGPIVSSPAIDEDTVYFGSGDKNLYAIRLLDGKKKWAYRSKQPIYSTPVVSGDQVLYRNENGTVIVLDARTGEEQWSFPSSFPAPSTNRSSPAVVNETVYVGDKEGRFSALDLASGSLRWQFTAGAPIAGTPVVADGIVYFGCADGNLYALDAATGTERWRYAADAAVESPPAIGDFVVIFCDVYGTMYAVAENGEATAR
jgi:outer membrane protein assembly factor BamB